MSAGFSTGTRRRLWEEGAVSIWGTGGMEHEGTRWRGSGWGCQLRLPCGGAREALPHLGEAFDAPLRDNKQKIRRREKIDKLSLRAIRCEDETRKGGAGGRKARI